MKRQANVSPCPRISQSAHPLRGKTLLGLAAAAVVLLGCQQDMDRGPGAIEPAAGSPQSGARDDTSPSGGPSGVTGSESPAPDIDAGGEDEEAPASGSAGAAGSTTSGPSGAGTGSGTSDSGASGGAS